MTAATPPVGVALAADVEYRPDRRTPFRARVRWVDPATKRRQSRSEAFETAAAGPDPTARLFTGPRGGRITTALLRDATHWDEVVTTLG
ncbi:MAG: hypothetical protein ACRDUW_22600, partial [Pseudonocardiaceae bacterium]